MPSMVLTGAAQSFVSVDKTVMDADGVESCGIAITLFSTEGEDEPLVNVPAALAVVSVNGTGNTVTQPTGVTSSSGGITGASFVTTVEETKTVTVTVAGLALAQQPTVDAGGSITPPASGEPFFEDDFAGPAMNDANGFTWGPPNNTSAVEFDGAGALRFTFDGDWAEQRFALGRDCRDLWIEFDWHVPANYAHGVAAPDNNKFLMIWRDTYSDVAGGTWRCGYEYRADGSNSTIRPMSSEWDRNSNSSSGLDHPDLNAPFIGGTGPVIIGQWNQIRMQFSASTDRTTSDGIMRMWVNGTLFAELTTGRFNNFYETPADCVLRNGYFMGAANAPFAEATVFHMRAMKFYDTDPGWAA